MVLWADSKHLKKLYWYSRNKSFSYAFNARSTCSDPTVIRNKPPTTMFYQPCIKINIIIKIFIFQLVWVPNFTLNTQFWIQKGYLRSRKVNITNKFSLFKLVKIPNFNLKPKIWNFGPKLPQKNIFSVQIIKNGHHHQTRYVRVIPGIRFQMKQINFEFWTLVFQNFWLTMKIHWLKIKHPTKNNCREIGCILMFLLL